MVQDRWPTADVFLEEPITGWRFWNLSEERMGPRLQPAGAGVDAWQPRRRVEARCGVPALLRVGRNRHSAPDVRCRCGIHASRSLEVIEPSRPAWPPTPVVGTVALWGRIVEHERGWRAQFAYPARLRLVCAMCVWFEPGPGLPVVVHSFSGRLYTLCSVHRGGIELPDGRRTRRTDIDPKALQDRLLNGYAVDLVPIEAVRSLFGRRATPVGPTYLPSIHVVPVEEEGRSRAGSLRSLLDALGW
jgi:hypothetical protein